MMSKAEENGLQYSPDWIHETGGEGIRDSSGSISGSWDVRLERVRNHESIGSAREM